MSDFGMRAIISDVDDRAATDDGRGTDESEVPVVVVDTTTTQQDPRLASTAWIQLLSLCARGQVRLVVPEVVMRETLRHMHKSVRETVRGMEGRINRLAEDVRTLASYSIETGVNPPPAPSFQIDEDALTRLLTERLSRVGAEMPPLPQVSVQELLERDLAERKPFSSTGKGMRDALIWATVADVALDSHGASVYFVTANSSDFTDGAGSLHAQLLSELGPERPISVVPTLKELLQLDGFSGLLGDLAVSEDHLQALLADDGDDEPAELTMDDLIRTALVGAVEELVGEEVSYGDYPGDGLEMSSLTLDPSIENPTITYAEANPDTADWQIYETFDDTTLLVQASISSNLEFEGFVYKSDAYHLPASVRVVDWDWNDHYVQVQCSVSVVLTFQLRAEVGVGVDNVEFESAVPIEALD